MHKFLVAALGTALLSTTAFAAEPARRPQQHPTSYPARALCRDSTYECMYDCTVEEGAVCMPTRSSDPNCPGRRVTNGHWISNKLIVLDFEGYHDMACKVTALPRTNLVCGDTQFGWDCWVGKMHERRMGD